MSIEKHKLIKTAGLQAHFAPADEGAKAVKPGSNLKTYILRQAGAN
jgi:hypothetical protein